MSNRAQNTSDKTHKKTLQAISNIDERHRRLVELNVQESCMNLFANPIVQKKQAVDSQPKIHGWVYDVGTGLLKKLEIDFKVRHDRAANFTFCGLVVRLR